ncbi:helix-turn-helix domain-containing protein [Kineococcus sp. LSe6-4]|uniref:Helix-turn-helix domain-containing protein n=1 Tax=Kineococcus halophytocola TaxID=3234027 RepID=A0ABV4H6I9_9ACTN
MKTATTPEPLVSGEYAAALLGKDERWLRNNAGRLRLPRYKIGQQYRYRLSEISAWIDSQATR